MRDRLRLLKALWKDPRTPWYAKAVLGFTVVYALSPLDLIPDFVPVLGYVDDLLIVPFGAWLACTLVPRELWREHRLAIESEAGGPESAQGNEAGHR